MQYLICYDIENDRLRQKISDRLVADGLERVQYSVFMGRIKEPLLKALQAWVKETLKNGKGENDSVIFLRIQVADIRKMVIFGKDSIDRIELLGERNTLII
ncbi:MAG: CRISPR-associated endonuclease Cas2 [Bacteroidia bacterium]|nr:CRISPR-associated endonuclease Cas2 [Bacteroidia bacterium]